MDRTTGLYWVGKILLNALVDGLGAVFGTNQEYDTCRTN
jgi:hypothetical protein